MQVATDAMKPENQVKFIISRTHAMNETWKNGCNEAASRPSKGSKFLFVMDIFASMNFGQLQYIQLKQM